MASPSTAAQFHHINRSLPLIWFSICPCLPATYQGPMSVHAHFPNAFISAQTSFLIPPPSPPTLFPSGLCSNVPQNFHIPLKPHGPSHEMKKQDSGICADDPRRGQTPRGGGGGWGEAGALEDTLPSSPTAVPAGSPALLFCLCSHQTERGPPQSPSKGWL